MSSSPVDVSDSRARSQRREAERQRLRDERKVESSNRRAARSGSADAADDPNCPLAEERSKWREKQRAKAAASEDTSGQFEGELSREDQVIMHAKKLQADNSQTLKNTIKVARETTVVGAATIHKLNEQTEQFNRMDNALEETNESLTRSERILRGMKSIGGAISQISIRTHALYGAARDDSISPSSVFLSLASCVRCRQYVLEWQL
jgi:hypothetical protein